MKRVIKFLSVLVLLSQASSVGLIPNILAQGLDSEKKPNFLWILSEDNSKHFLKIFDEAGAETPNIQLMARHGIQFNRAFSCSPVCSVARTTLMTSVYAPRLGTQYHRKIQNVTQPEGWHIFTAFLRKHGYYTSNNSKKDYNIIEKGEGWDESSKQAHWKNRKNEGQPFFHMHTFGQSHESSLHFSEKSMSDTQTETNPESVFIPPFHPDTPTFRYTYARYHDKIKVIDQQVGQLIRELKETNELENTFVFYFGDHGGVLPGSKGYINERGIHVPLVVRIPDNFKHLVDAKRNSTNNGFVSFVDFGPTVLNLAGIQVPEYSDGKPFLGPDVFSSEVESRSTAFSHADRFGEKCDLVRAIRIGKWKYVRNFQSYLPDGLRSNYRYKMLAYQEWRDLFHQEKTNKAQSLFFLPKTPEMLFDLEKDPYELNNLSDKKQHQPQIRKMRNALKNQMISINDLGLFPEHYLAKIALKKPISFGKNHKREIKKYLKISELATKPFDRVKSKLSKVLQNSDPFVQFWALNTCSEFGVEAHELIENTKPLLSSPDLMVRFKAAEFLAIAGKIAPQHIIYDILKQNDDPILSLEILNSVVYFKDHLGFSHWNISEKSVKAHGPESQARFLYLQ